MGGAASGTDGADAEPVLYVVAECPIDFAPVVILRGPNGPDDWIRFASCCGVAWRGEPRGDWDGICDFKALGLTRVVLPTRSEIEASPWRGRIRGTEPLQHIGKYLPL